MTAPPTSRRPLRDALQRPDRDGILVADGGMGTQLQLAGLEPGDCGDAWNLAHPDRVQAIQRRYVDAGAHILLTNTFGTNHFVLSRYGLESKVADLAGAAAANARAAAGDRAWVLGDIGPCGGFLSPMGEIEPDDLEASWREVMRALLAGGVDGIIIETMTALDELLLGVRLAKSLGAPLVIASMSYDPVRSGGVKTMMGVSPEEAARASVEAGADVVGANCGRLEPEAFVEVGRALKVAGGVPVMLQPNAGQPHLEGDIVVYPRGPADLAPALVALAKVADIVGGCCGTTPAHIGAFVELMGRK
jgi:5-methyltetrahydrofolate--homocysteine methyltransferase